MHAGPAYLKKLSAFILFGLLLFIQAEKNMHGHAGTEKKLTGTTVNAAFKCLLCEYQLAADAGIPAEAVVQVPLFFSTAVISYFIPADLSPHRLSFTGRGPPSHC